MLDRRSYLFSDDFAALTSGAENGEGLSAKASAHVREVAALYETVRRLRTYAVKDMAVLSAGMPCKPGGPSDRMPDLTGDGMTVSAADLERLERDVHGLNRALGAMIPGVAVQLKRIGKTLMSDGGMGVRVEPVSVRDGGATIPLRRESAGIRRIIELLPHLIRAFNDPDVCVAIDGLDTDVFEYLFGAMLEEFVRVGRGQLIFTAHNLRPMERMQPTSDTIVLSTLDPQNRFIPYRGLGKTNNPRRQYFNALELGGTTVPLYKGGMTQLIGAGFTLAGNEHDQIDQQVEDGMRTLLDVPVDGLEEALC